MRKNQSPEIDPGYLSWIIKAFLKQDIKNPKLIPLLGDASDRSYYRILFKTDKEKGSFILMKLAEPHLSGEPPFLNIQRYLKKHKIPVPEVFYYDEKKGFILLEDLGPLTLEERLKGEKREIKRKFYKEAINILLEIQESGDEKDKKECIAYSLEFDVEKFMWELDFFISHMIEGLLKKEMDGNDKERLRKNFLFIVETITDEKKVFTHRDYHSRNIMIDSDRLGIVDFQDARMGLCQYDLASLLRDSYLVLEDDLREELIHYYISEKENREKKEIKRDHFIRIFDYTSLQRNLKAIGTFSFQRIGKNNDRYLPYIDDTLEYVEENLKKYDELNELREILWRYIKRPFKKEEFQKR